MLSEKDTTVDEVNRIVKEESETERYRGIVGITDDPVVSSDMIGDSHASTIDVSMTHVVDGDLIKLMCWYDNEWGYASQMVREAVRFSHG
jgi:glyceraldehyde 3-phosphate dehydrogenase